MTHKCPVCGIDVPDERRELLGVETCVKCTKQKPKPKGAMVYPHKTGGVLAICDTDEDYEAISKSANPRKEEE